jgi:hypothetical protein
MSALAARSRRRFLSASALGTANLPGHGRAEPPPEVRRSTPQKIIAQGTDWRFWNELKRELKA